MSQDDLAQDLAQIAYEAWAYHVPWSDDDGAPALWEELSDEQTKAWIAVEQRFIELRDGDPDEGPDSVEFALEYPPPEPPETKGTNFRKPATRFRIRRPTAADSIVVQDFDPEERDLRLALSCMTPVPANARFSWRELQEFELDDIVEAKALVLDGWRSLEGHLYEAWREPAVLAADLDFAGQLHPEDIEAFIAYEREHKNRPDVLAALEERGKQKPAVDDERWEGDPAFGSTWDWRDLVRVDHPLKLTWFHVGMALARAADGETISLFTPGVERSLTPSIARVRGHEIMAMRRASNDEERMLALAASLCEMKLDHLKRLKLDDFMRVAATAQQEWLPNRQRGRGPKSGSRSEKPISPALQPSSDSASTSSP